jgi:hypothetical protein
VAGEIVIPIHLDPHRSTNANGSRTVLDMTNDLHQPGAWRLPTTVAVDYSGGLAWPIPSWINATPAGKIYLQWTTASSNTSNNIKLLVYAFSTAEGDALDPAAWTDSLSVLDTSAGTWKQNESFVSLSGVSQTAGKSLWIVVRRNKPGESGDQLDAACFLLKTWYVADKA